MSVSGGTPHSICDFGRRLTLHCPLRRPRLSGKTTGAYLLPSAGLSTAHLHIDGKSMGSLQCAINITNDQFKPALSALPVLTAVRSPRLSRAEKRASSGVDAHMGQMYDNVG